MTGIQTSDHSLDVDQAVRSRYSDAAQEMEPQLCCPVDYDSRYLEAIPAEILERDYGCGDPSRHVQQGDVVLDLGSGGGKICYIASQVVGAEGRVIGVDYNEDMLDLANRHRAEIGDTLGYHNVEFRKGRIQDLQLDLGLLEEQLAQHPVATSSDYVRLEELTDSLRKSAPLVQADSVDVVVSNCVLNLVRPADRNQLFREVMRVLKRGGRAVISDIVSDEDVPTALQNDPKLWSGCISGAFREDAFLAAFEDAGFYGIEILERQAEPWAIVEGIEFRSLTVRAWKGKDGPCFDQKQAVVYRGPWKAVIDDDGHTLYRGQRTATCGKTFDIYTKPPYADQFIGVEPAQPVPLESAKGFDCSQDTLRDPRETKATREVSRNPLTIMPSGDCCGPNCC